MSTVERIANEENRLLHWAATASICVAAGLILVKAYAYWVSGSVSLLASLADSVIDSMASLINLLAIRYAMQPADEEHRFGHGKAESLAGLGQAIFIMGSAIYLMVEALDRMVNPRPIEQLDVALIVMLLSIAATFCLVMFQRYVINKTGSVAIKADSLHYLSDLLTNVGVVIALVLTFYGWVEVDAILAIGISIYIFYTAIQIWSESIQHLLDRELPTEEQRKIEGIALAHEDVLGVHELRTRQAGRIKIIQLHLELDGKLPLWKAHKVSDEVEHNIHLAFPQADILIHQDPFTEHAVEQ